MTRPTTRFLATLTRERLAEVLTPTYAKLKNVDPNEAYTRLDNALRSSRLMDDIQQSVWRALQREKPDWDEPELVDHLGKRLDKKRRFKAPSFSASEEGAWVALAVLIDREAGVSSGEAADLIDTDMGRRLVDDGLDKLGRFLAKELLR